MRFGKRENFAMSNNHIFRPPFFTAQPENPLSLLAERLASYHADTAGGTPLSLPAMLHHIEAILPCVGRDPKAAALGWRTGDSFAHALLCAMHGLRLFPCDILKRPTVRHGLKVATSSIETLCYWVRTTEAQGWCIATGRYEIVGGPAGLWVFDIDDSAGYAWLAELEAKLGPLPQSWTVMSGRVGGGEHRYFAPAGFGPDMKTVPRAMILGKRGKIDQKGRGGYCVGAASAHRSGNPYYYKDGCAPGEIPLATLSPEWVAAMDKASEPATPKTGSGYRVPRPSFSNPPDDPSSRKMGDGPGCGGFHGPINRLAIIYFLELGADAPVEPIIGWLRNCITEAPKAPGRDVSRYIGDDYLVAAVESARQFVRTFNQ